MPSENNRRPNLQIFIEYLDLLYAEIIRFCPRYRHRLMCILNHVITFSSPYLNNDAKTIPVLRDFYLKEKVSKKDLEAECRM